MKKSVMRKLLAIAGCVTLFCAMDVGVTWAVPAAANAKVAKPIAISKTVDLDFGKFAADPANAATVVMSNAGIRSATGDIKLLTETGITPAAAAFSITGENDLTYTITLPTDDVTLTKSGAPGTTMTVNVFSSTPSGTGTLSATGTSTLAVGATLNVAAGQPEGTYTGSFDVTVNYQ